MEEFSKASVSDRSTKLLECRDMMKTMENSAKPRQPKSTSARDSSFGVG